VDRVRRQASKVAGRDCYRLAVDLEIDFAFQDIISFVPIVPMWRRAHAERDILVEQRPALTGFARVAEET
jgi:hypothetical protein